MAILLYLALICLVTLLIVLIEGVVLTWLKWASFGQSLVSALVANLPSTFVSVLILSLFKHQQVSYLAIAWLVSLLIDSGVFLLFKRQPAWRTLLTAAVANLASYIVLISPAYFYNKQPPL